MVAAAAPKSGTTTHVNCHSVFSQKPDFPFSHKHVSGFDTWIHTNLLKFATWPRSLASTWCTCNQAQLPRPLSAPRPCSLSMKIHFSGESFLELVLSLLGTFCETTSALWYEDFRKWVLERTYGTETPSAENLIASVFETKREIPQRTVITSLRQHVSILLSFFLRFVSSRDLLRCLCVSDN